MLVIFDVDGTLVGGEPHDWACFDQAIGVVLGAAPGREFFASLPEITAQSIAEEAIRAAGFATGVGLEEQIRDEYLRRLIAVHASDPSAFPPRTGATELLAHLAAMPGVTVAIATGDWHSTISFKLSAAGIDVSSYAMATSSESNRRSTIIGIAARKTGRPLADAVYIGDGVWDLRACRELNLPFIGTGARTHRLKEAGAEHLIEVFEVAAFLAMLQAALRLKQEEPS